MVASIPANEEKRLAVLTSLNILDTLPQSEFDDLCEVVCALLDVPIALISLIDRDRQWFKARSGVDVCEMPRDTSFCSHAILEREPLVVPDTWLDPRFAHNPLVLENPKVRFYVGVPIVVDGLPVGTLCGADTRPREIDQKRIDALRALGRQVESLFLARRQTAAYLESERRFLTFLDHAPVLAFLKDENLRLRFTNRLHSDVYGCAPDDLLGLRDEQRMAEEFACHLRAHDEEVLRNQVPIERDVTVPHHNGQLGTWRAVKFPIEFEGRTWVGGVALDVTEQRLAEDTVRRQSEELARALAAAESATESARLAALRFEQLFAGLPIACYSYDAEGTIYEWNSAAEDLWSISNAEAALSSIYGTVVSPENFDAHRGMVARVFAGESLLGQEREETMPDGSRRWLLTNTFPLKSAKGEIVGAVSANVDVTERKRMEQAVRASEARLRSVVDSLQEGVVVQNADGRVSMWNRSAERIIGIGGEKLDLRSKHDPRAKAFREDGSDFPVEERPAAVAIRTGQPCEATVGIRKHDGEMRWMNLMAVPYPMAEGEKPQAVVSFLDVTERRKIENALRESEQRFRSVLESLHEGLVVHDREGRIVYWNRSAERVLGMAGEQLSGRKELARSYRTIHEDGSDYPHDEHPIALARRTGKVQEAAIMGVQRPDGEFRWISVNAAPVSLDESDSPSAAVASFLDVTERLRQEKLVEAQMSQISAYSAELEEANGRLRALATLDGLTGLKNHRSFQERLEEEIHRSRRTGSPLAIALLDVDRFKRFNDDLGHQAGDAVLRGVGSILTTQARTNDFVARYGGEEFVVILPDTALEEAKQAVERIRQAVEGAPWPDRPVTASFGVATLAVGIGREELIKRADEALYTSKAHGRNRVTAWLDEATSKAA